MGREEFDRGGSHPFLGFDPEDVEVREEWTVQRETFRRRRFRLVEFDDGRRAIAKRTEERHDDEWSVGPRDGDDWTVFAEPADFEEVNDVEW